MADPQKRLDTNTPGEFFVDNTCINCDTCRQLAPGVFGEERGFSCVTTQPGDETALRLATRALLSCPTGSIGTSGRNLAKDVMRDFPLALEGNVFYCGFNSPQSYGGNSYFVQHEQGNWLIDSPKYLPQLVKRFRELGGVEYIFLTHRDDVPDAASYANEFQAKRIIHADDLSAAPQCEIVVKGTDDKNFGSEFLVIPTPGHTKGHCVLLYGDRYLFTGDHLAWERDMQGLDAWPDYCWYSWEEQKESLSKLLKYRFEWVLPGHGQRIHLEADEMRRQLEVLCDRIGAEAVS